jgi:hypothetical protein
VTVLIACVGRRCNVAASARLTIAARGHARRIALRRISATVAGGATRRVRFTLSKHTRRLAAQALRRHGRLSVSISAKVTDAANAAATLTRTVRLTR